MLDQKLQDKIPCSEIRKRTKIIDIIEYTLKQKWKWAGHIARMKDNRWTKCCTVATKEREEIKRMTRQKMARQQRREPLGLGKQQATMEDIDGGLHPAVDGQSLDEDEDEEFVLVPVFAVSFYSCFASEAKVNMPKSNRNMGHSLKLGTIL